MSHVDAGPLASYNSLTDRHLATYFSNARMRNHLIKTGLLTKQGEVVPDNVYRIKMARREHRRTIRDLLAQAIVHKTLDMERYRQVSVRQKIEEISKIELVKRVKAQRHRKGDEELLPFFSQKMRRPKTQPNRLDNNDDSGKKKSSRDRRRNLSPDSESRQRMREQFPKEEIDTKHLRDLDGIALREYARILERQARVRDPSPHVKRRSKSATGHSQRTIASLNRRQKSLLLKQESVSNSARGDQSSHRSRDSNEDQKESSRKRQDEHTRKKKKKYPQENLDYAFGQAILRRTEPAVMYQEKLQSLCEVTMKYFGQSIVTTREDMDPCQEVMVVQQHCGGNTLTVFKERIRPNSNFNFISRRHRGYPFSLTFYINGVNDCRLSTCCEYKHKIGSRLGGKMGHFGFVGVEGAAPCYKCQVEKGLIPVDTKKSKEKEKEKDEAARERNNCIPRQLSAPTRRKPNAIFDPAIDRQYSQMNFNSPLDDSKEHHHWSLTSRLSAGLEAQAQGDSSDEYDNQDVEDAIRLNMNPEQLQLLDLRNLPKLVRRKSVDDAVVENSSPRKMKRKSRSIEEENANLIVASFVDEDDNFDWMRDTNNSGRHNSEDNVEIEVESEDDYSNKAEFETIDRNRPVKTMDHKNTRKPSIESYIDDFEDEANNSFLDDRSQRVDENRTSRSDGENYSDTDAESLDDFEHEQEGLVQPSILKPDDFEVMEDESINNYTVDDYAYQVCEPICQSPQLYSITERTEPPDVSGAVEHNTSEVIHIPGWSVESTNKSQEVAIASEMTLLEAKETSLGATEDNITSHNHARKSTYGVVNTVLTEDEASGYEDYEFAHRFSPLSKFQTEIPTVLEVQNNEDLRSDSDTNSSLSSQHTKHVPTTQIIKELSTSSKKKTDIQSDDLLKEEPSNNIAELDNDTSNAGQDKQDTNLITTPEKKGNSSDQNEKSPVKNSRGFNLSFVKNYRRKKSLEKSQMNNNTSDFIEDDDKRPESRCQVDNVSLRSDSGSSSSIGHSKKVKMSSKSSILKHSDVESVSSQQKVKSADCSNVTVENSTNVQNVLTELSSSVKLVEEKNPDIQSSSNKEMVTSKEPPQPTNNAKEYSDHFDENDSKVDQSPQQSKDSSPRKLSSSSSSSSSHAQKDEMDQKSDSETSESEEDEDKKEHVKKKHDDIAKESDSDEGMSYLSYSSHFSS